MNQKFRWLSKISLFATTLLTLSCSNDDTSQQNAHQHKHSTIKEIPFAELMKKPTFSKSYEKVAKKMLRNRSSHIARTAMEDELGFTISTTPAKVIETDSLISYTLLINTDDQNSSAVGNLVVQVDKNRDNTQAMICKYNLTSLIIPSADGSFGFSADTEITPIFYENSDTSAERTTICVTIMALKCSYGGTEHDAGENCTRTYWDSSTECTTSGGAGSGTDTGTNAPGGSPSSSGTPSGGGIHGGSNSNNTQVIITAPVIDPFYTAKKNFFRGLSSDQQLWLNSFNMADFSNPIKDDIFNYLDENFHSTESVLFAETLIDEIRNVTINPLPTDISIVDFDSSNEITNINEYLECFNLNQAATFTLYVDQPTANNNSPWSGIPGTDTFSVGHTFIGIKQGNIARILGFYPKNEVTLSNPSGLGTCENDSGHDYDVSISYNINSTKLIKVINYIKTKANAQYNLNTYNCSDFGMSLTKSSGLTLPSAYGTWGSWATGSGAGDNPGQLGQNIRNIPTPSGSTKTLSSGNAPTNSGTCN